ncbi:MAG TPA: MFS transporter, partial [Kineosporiaceae bacterium]
STLMLGLLEGGQAWPWGSAVGVGLPAAGLALLVGFVLVERRVVAPVLPLWVMSRRTLAGGNLVAAAVGALLIGVTSYAPTYLQGVLGVGPLTAGLAVAALTVGWPLAATYCGRIYLRIGFRATCLIGASAVLLGTLGSATLSAHSALWQVTVLCFVIGVGLGLLSGPAIVAVQSAVGWNRRGVVTAATMFFRTIGGALGVACFGAVVNATLTGRLARPPAGLAGRIPTTEDGAVSALRSHPPGLAAPALAFLRDALAAATHHVFVGLALVAALAVGAAALLPREVVTVEDVG